MCKFVGWIIFLEVGFIFLVIIFNWVDFLVLLILIKLMWLFGLIF